MNEFIIVTEGVNIFRYSVFAISNLLLSHLFILYLFFYFHLNRIIEDEGRLVYSDKKHIIVKLEDLPNVDYMQSLSNLLFIDYIIFQL